MTTPTTARRALQLATATLLAATLAGCGFFEVSESVRRCNLLTQEPCTATEACVAPNNAQCAEAGTKAVGQACTTLNDCVREAICVGVDSDRTCRARCSLAAPSCAADETCVTGTNGDNKDGFGICTKLACDPLAQTGCPDGQRCIPGPIPSCSAVIGVAKEGASCASSESCQVRMVCAQSAASGAAAQSSCIAICDASGTSEAGTCADGYRCDALVDGDGFALPAHQGTCILEHCNALTDFGCKDSEKCYAASKPVCGFPGNNQLGQACEKVIDCGVGLICIQGSDGQRLCRGKCDTTGDNPAFACPSGEVCVAVNGSDGSPLPNNVGFCRLP